MEILENIDLSITPFESKILGVTKEYIFLEEEYFLSDEGVSFPCVLKILREEYLKMINLFLDSKQDFCERWGEFCGVCGNFYIENFKQIETTDLLVDFDDEKEEPIYKNVPVFEIISWDTHCDMEHG